VKIGGESTKVDYVRVIPLRSKNVYLLPKYYKYIVDLKYTCSGYNGNERDMTSIDVVISLISLSFDAQTGEYTLAESDKSILDTFVKNEMTRMLNACAEISKLLSNSSSKVMPTTLCQQRKLQASSLLGPKMMQRVMIVTVGF
jgi:hypothetical protein